MFVTWCSCAQVHPYNSIIHSLWKKNLIFDLSIPKPKQNLVKLTYFVKAKNQDLPSSGGLLWGCGESGGWVKEDITKFHPCTYLKNIIEKKQCNKYSMHLCHICQKGRKDSLDCRTKSSDYVTEFILNGQNIKRGFFQDKVF